MTLRLVASLVLVLGTFPQARPAEAQQELPVWNLVEELRVGSIDGPQAFAALGPVTVSERSGTVFVNEFNERILALDSTGSVLRAIGRKGEGPGEFGHLVDIFWVDGQLMATDGHSHRVSWFSEDGEVVESRLIESGPIEGAARRARPDAPLGERAYLGLLQTQVERNGLMSYDVTLLSMDGAGKDRIIAEFPVRDSWYPAPGGLYLPIPMTGGGVLASHPHGDGLVILQHEVVDEPDSATFRLRRIGGDGILRFSRGYRYDPQPLPEEYVEDFVQSRREGIERFGMSLREAERVIGRLVPRYHRPVSEVLMGADGTTWLKREEVGADRAWWWVLDARGEPIGSLRLPRALRVRYVRGDRVWAVETDDLGVYYLTRYRIER